MRRSQRGGNCRERCRFSARFWSSRSWRLSHVALPEMPFSLGEIKTVGGNAHGQGQHGGHVGCSPPTVSELRQTKHRWRNAHRSTLGLKYAPSPALAHRHPQPGCGEDRRVQVQRQVCWLIETLLLTVWQRLHSIEMLRRPRRNWALEIVHAGGPYLGRWLKAVASSPDRVAAYCSPAAISAT